MPKAKYNIEIGKQYKNWKVLEQNGYRGNSQLYLAEFNKDIIFV